MTPEQDEAGTSIVITGLGLVLMTTALGIGRGWAGLIVAGLALAAPALWFGALWWRKRKG